jgi:hypothetical protein
MSYNPNIPLVNDQILQSFRQIRSNFQAINAAFSSNHPSLTISSDNLGRHNVLVLRPQSADPTTSSSQVAIYNKLVSTIPQLFFRPSSNATPIQMSYQSVSTDPSAGQQYTFLPGPFILYGGKLSGVSNNQLVSLSPNSNLLYVGLTVIAAGTGTIIQEAIPINVSGSSFNVGIQNSPVTTVDLYYTALGQP